MSGKLCEKVGDAEAESLVEKIEEIDRHCK